MITHCRFLDGLAIGVGISLARAPLMLRLVRSPDGKWDALDQLDDEAREDEEIFVYRASSKPAAMFVDKTIGGRRVGERAQCLEYREWPHPGDEHVRITATWSDWCDKNKELLMKGRTDDDA